LVVICITIFSFISCIRARNQLHRCSLRTVSGGCWRSFGLSRCQVGSLCTCTCSVHNTCQCPRNHYSGSVTGTVDLLASTRSSASCGHVTPGEDTRQHGCNSDHSIRWSSMTAACPGGVGSCCRPLCGSAECPRHCVVDICVPLLRCLVCVGLVARRRCARGSACVFVLRLHAARVL